MADPWIRVHADLGSKPITMRAAAALGVKRCAAAGYLVFFWGNVSRHSENGLVAHYPDELLELWAAWEGTRGRFAKFIRENHLDGDGRVKEWDEYAGALEQRKAKNREHQAAWRARHKPDVSLTQDLRKGVTIRNETKRNEEDQRQLLAGDDKPPSSPAPKRKREAKPVENWVGELGDWWVATIGSVTYGQLGRYAKPIHALHGLDAIKRAAPVYFSPDEGPRFKTVADFFANFAHWHALALEPMSRGGVPTERAMKIMRGGS